MLFLFFFINIWKLELTMWFGSVDRWIALRDDSRLLDDLEHLMLLRLPRSMRLNKMAMHGDLYYCTIQQRVVRR